MRVYSKIRNIQKMNNLLQGASVSRLTPTTNGQISADIPKQDTAEHVFISFLALLKMLKHGRAGVPLEVMGLMLGNFVDDYTVDVVDVFAMPQKGSGISVESVDEPFQAEMLQMLKLTGRPEMVVGWYHSHPGFGSWLSGTDVLTQRTYEMLHERAVAVVIDPIQSVKGKVIIDAFRCIQDQLSSFFGNNLEPRQCTSNLGHLKRPSVKALVHGLNKSYYSIAISYRKNELEQQMLLKMNKKDWSEELHLPSFVSRADANLKAMESMNRSAKGYSKAIEDEGKLSAKELVLKNIGKQDPKRHLEKLVEEILDDNVIQGLGAMLKSVTFK